ncbi:Rid family hydrolase [Caulobacter sp. NIBR2454]|uniref:Rid family hydrolase n=1 Tax=Caulobacter sp. NIBR2454 TaxID=3015996 RepID=UPI0022B690B7|nr:Rid family hydrolase [Caulobacter sp. NIBR2454]
MLRALALAAGLLAAVPAAAQTAPQYPVKIPAPGGEAIIPNAMYQREYDEVGYAAARRVGDTLYVSGGIVARRKDEGNDEAAFKAQTLRTYKQLEATLKAAGASWDDVVMVNSFHVWDSPNFTGKPMDQIRVMTEVRRSLSSAPAPAWTAVGTTGLLAPTGIVEVQVIAHMPKK